MSFAMSMSEKTDFFSVSLVADKILGCYWQLIG